MRSKKYLEGGARREIATPHIVVLGVIVVREDVVSEKRRE